VKIHGHRGTSIASKIILRCRNCSKAGHHSGRLFGKKQDIHYHPTRYGNETHGYKLYDSHLKVHYTEASESVFIENDFMRHYLEEFHHGWLSFQAKAEAFNQANVDTYEEKRVKTFVLQHPEVGRRFQKKSRTAEADEGDGIDNDESEGNNACETLMHELTRKSLSQAILNYEVRKELIGEGKIKDELFGPKKGAGNEHISYKESRRVFFEATDVKRKQTLYPHRCFRNCSRRGCKDISTFDGLWKIHHPLCMWNCSTMYPKEITQYLPQACPSAPLHGKAFCRVHCEAAEQLGQPTDLRGFLKSCKTDPNNQDKEARGKVNAVLKQMAEAIKVKQTTVGEDQGTEFMIRNEELVNTEKLKVTEESVEECRKDVGDVKKLRRYNRGVFLSCSGGGHIWSFDTLYNSEGTTQVALLKLRYLMRRFPPDRSSWKGHTLNYDNMCNAQQF